MPRAKAALAAAALLAFYLAFPDFELTFDGVMFSMIIEGRGIGWEDRVVNARHFLFNPLMILLREGARLLGHVEPAYSLIRKMNAALGVFGILLFYDFLRRLTKNVPVAILFAGVLGLSFGYAGRATEGQVYMLMTFGALATLSAALHAIEAPGRRSGIVLAIAFLCATLFHAMNFVLFPAVGWALVCGARRGKRAKALLPLGLSLLVFLSVYAAAFQLYGFDRLISFFTTAAEYDVSGSPASLDALLRSFFHSGGLGLSARLALIPRELSFSLVSSDSSALGLPAALAVLGLAAMLARSWTKRPGVERAAAVLLVLTLLSYLTMNAFWMGGKFFYSVPLAALLGLAALAASKRRPAPSLIALVFVFLWGWNAWAGLAPRSRPEFNPNYVRAAFIRDHTVETGMIVMSGATASTLKAYLPYFLSRSAWPLENALIGSSKAAGLARVRAFLSQQIQHGIPLFVLSDLVTEEGRSGPMFQQWGITLDEVRACFGPGKFVPVARYDADVAFSFFIPDGFKAESFAGLAFNYLHSSTGERAGPLLKAVVAGMSREEKARTRALLAKSRNGALLVIAGMGPTISSSGRLAIPEPPAAQVGELERLLR